MAANVDEVMTSINTNCRQRGGVYQQYSCKTVSWDDVQRGTVGGAVSNLGSNITDTRLWEKTGRRLFTVRSDNWNEKLGKVSAGQVALIIGNHRPGRGSDGVLGTVSLATFLTKIGEYGQYAGLPWTQNLFDTNLDQEISIRFQTTFLPVADEQKATLEFASEMYNYQTMSDTDPKNLLLLCTTQGTAVQQDGAGAKKLYHHLVDPGGKIHRHWLEAERTEHKVGKAQIETEEEKEDAIARGKATAKLIGLESMETRFNVLMTIQVPLQQTQRQPNPGWGGYSSPFQCQDECASVDSDYSSSSAKYRKAKVSTKQRSRRMEKCKGNQSTPAPEIGKANAARVSRGTEVDVWPGLSLTLPATRHRGQHVTVTVVIYNTVAGGVPSADDVIGAIDDMEALYASCQWTGRLADDGAAFMKKELTVGDLQGIADNMHNQSYKPESVPKEAKSPRQENQDGE